MWDQVRVDHGTEFYLTLYMQEKNADLRRNVNRQPYIQTESKRVSLVQIVLAVAMSSSVSIISCAVYLLI